MTDVETFVILADAQIPYHDERALACALDYIHDVRPAKVILLGDWLDLPQLTTKFLKEADLTSIQSDIEILQEYIDMISMYTKEIVYIFGNHEDRWRTYTLSQAPELAPFIGPEGVFALSTVIDRPKVTYVQPYDTAYIYKSFHFKHGIRHNKYVANIELLHEGSSGMSGHKHTAQMHTKTDRSGAHAWYSVPCLCNVAGPNAPPGYEKGLNAIRDWSQGFATVSFANANGRGIFNAHMTIITDGACIGPNGRVYRG